MSKGNHTLSVVLATRNEEENIGDCIDSFKGIADDIVVVDEYSSDKTRDIAKAKGARVFKEVHHDIFHITKQIALEKARGEWILQLDADERVTPELGKEILEAISMASEEIEKRKIPSKKRKLFERHQRLLEKRDGRVGENVGEVVAFFLPRRNMFLGKPLIHAGVYPDGVIRLVKRGKAKFLAKSVHEQIEIDGKVSWLVNDLEHHDSPTFKRYLDRANRYTSLTAKEMKEAKTSKGVLVLLYYSTLKPLFVFLKLYVRHLGFLDGIRGFIWSLFSALHFPIAYWKYWTGK